MLQYLSSFEKSFCYKYSKDVDIICQYYFRNNSPELSESTMLFEDYGLSENSYTLFWSILNLAKLFNLFCLNFVF